MKRLASLFISSSLVSLVGAARAADPAAANPASATTAASATNSGSSPVVASAAHPPGPPAPEEMLVSRDRATVRTFYGWEILIGGEGGGALAALSLLLPDRPLGTVAGTAGFIIGTPVYVLAGPVAHWSHDDFAKGLVSFGANVVVPLTAGFIGRAARCSGEHGDNCELHGFFTGFALGLVTVPIVDALVLGWESVPVEDSGATSARSRLHERRSARAGFDVAPGFHLGPRGEIEIGVAGRF